MRALPLCLALLAVLIFVRPAFAAEETKWETFHSPTGVYSVNLPDEYKVETRTFRTAPGTIKDREGRVVNSEEVIARFDQRPYRKAVKNYIMRLDQTIGPNMTIPDVKRAIQKEMVNYINHYRKKGALITRKEILKRKAFWSGEIDLVYEDPELGVQGVKIRILFSDNTKLQQIFAGPEYLLEDKWVVDFFDSLYFLQGINKLEGQYKDEWIRTDSPLELFTIWVPPITKGFVEAEPEIKFSDQGESIKTVFSDPVRYFKIHYNVYGYRLPESLTYESAEKALMARHIAKYYKSPEGIEIKRIYGSAYSGLTTEFKHPPSKTEPYLDIVTLRCYFAQNYMVVQEMILPTLMRTEPFVQNVLDLIEFHPEKGHALFMKKELAAGRVVEMLEKREQEAEEKAEEKSAPEAQITDTPAKPPAAPAPDSPPVPEKAP